MLLNKENQTFLIMCQVLSGGRQWQIYWLYCSMAETKGNKKSLPELSSDNPQPTKHTPILQERNLLFLYFGLLKQ